ncbi:MAG: putative Ig domain-containing protein [Blastocatellia bacterium]
MFLRKSRLTWLSLMCVLATAGVVTATSIVIPSDDELIIGARAIVRGNVTAVASGYDDAHKAIFTYITLRVQEVFKGNITTSEIVIKEPGGVTGNRGSLIFGTPEFKTGENVLLYLDTWPDGSLRVHQWFLGKFTINTNRANGKLTLVRDAISGNITVLGRSQTGPITDRADISNYAEMLRGRIAATRAAAVKHESRFFAGAALRSRPAEMSAGSNPPIQNFTLINGSYPPRWFEPDTGQPVVFKINPAGAPNSTIINDMLAAMNAWSNVSGSSLRVTNGGSTSTCGLLVTDGENTISFNNCDNYSAFSPSGGGCSGILAAAGIISYSLQQTRVINGITFYRALEGNMSFNPYASCYFGNSCNVQEVATHEMGHALGLGHSLDSTATMHAYAHFDGRCAALRTDDASAIQFIYPGSSAVTPLAITTTGFPNAQPGTSYTQSLLASGGVPAYTWSLASGALPPGLYLNPTGSLTGMPMQAGNFSFSLMVRDANNSSSSRSYTMQVSQSCSFGISPNTQNFPAIGGSGILAVSVSSGCAWTATSSASWITINTTSGNGSGSVSYSVAANPTLGASRIGTITVANQSMTITQDGGQSGGTQALQYYPLAKPIRLLDTRAGTSGCTLPGTQIQAQVARAQSAWLTCNGMTIPATAQAITGNLAVVNSQNNSGYGTIYPAGGSPPLASNINYVPYEVTSSSFVTGLNASGQFNIFTFSTVDVVIDVTGYFAPPGGVGLYYHPLPQPIRLLETRPGQAGCITPGTPIQGQANRTVNAWVTCNGITIPSTARAVSGNFAVVNQLNSSGYGTVYPTGGTVPVISNINYSPFGIISNSFVAGLSASGQFNIFAYSTIHAVVDVTGYFSVDAVDSNGAGLLYTTLPMPLRLLDTRPGQAGCDRPGQTIQAQTPRSENAAVTCSGMTIPSTSRAITGNFTVVNQLNNYGYGAVYPAGGSAPLTATVNYTPFAIKGNSFMTGLNSEGQFALFTYSTVHAVVDVTGFFAP